jgi:hypothetical protein
MGWHFGGGLRSAFLGVGRTPVGVVGWAELTGGLRVSNVMRR